MKLTAIIALLGMLVMSEAMAQRRPPMPRPRPPRPMPVPPRRPVPVPPPTHMCRGADLYARNWVIHRFRWTNDCHVALRDLRFHYRFCDQGSMYDGNGYFLRQYRDQYECRHWL